MSISSSQLAGPVTFRQLGRLRSTGLRSRPGGAATGAFRLGTEVAAASLAAALTVVTERHDTLRMSFYDRDGDGSYACTVSPQGTIPLIEASLGTSAGPVAEQRRQDFMRQLTEPWDLAVAPLARCGLLRTRPAESLLVLAADHTIMDSWALDLVMNEILSTYDALARGSGLPPGLRADAPSFRERAEREAQVLRPGSAARQDLVARWRQKLGADGIFPPVPFPRTAAGPVTESTVLRYPVEFLHGLRRRCARDRMPDSALMAAATARAVAHETGYERLAVHFMSLGRARADELSMAGLLADFALLPMYVRKQDTLAETMRVARSAVMDAARDPVPLYVLIQDLAPGLEFVPPADWPVRIFLNMGWDGLGDAGPGLSFVAEPAVIGETRVPYGDGVHVTGEMTGRGLQIFVHSVNIPAASARRVVAGLDSALHVLAR